MQKLLRCASFLAISAVAACASEKKSSNPIEIGNIEWGRNYEEALKEAKEEDAPMLLFFQEVPG